MDVQNSSIKHLPVKVNNCVKRRQEDANKTSKWSIFSIFLRNFIRKFFIGRRRSVLNLCYVAFPEDDHLMHSRQLVNRNMVTLQEVKM